MELGRGAAALGPQLLDRHGRRGRRSACDAGLGLWHDAAVVFSTSPESRKGRNLARDPRLVVHLESGDEVVVVEGGAEQIALENAVADAYEAKYRYRPDAGSPEGLWYRVRPRVAYAWLERDYPRTATRFAFD
jgi:pyridoxine/pyridoxamine 5'-phosphate oxidase